MPLLINVLGLVIAAILGKIGLTLLRANRLEAERNASRASSLADAVKGRVQINNDWLPDGRVQGGIVYNKKLKRIEVSGRISDDSLDRTFR